MIDILSIIGNYDFKDLRMFEYYDRKKHFYKDPNPLGISLYKTHRPNTTLQDKINFKLRSSKEEPGSVVYKVAEGKVINVTTESHLRYYSGEEYLNEVITIKRTIRFDIESGKNYIGDTVISKRFDESGIVHRRAGKNLRTVINNLTEVVAEVVAVVRY